MAEKSLNEQLEDAQQQIKKLQSELEAAIGTIGRQNDQLTLLRKGIGMAQRGDIPKEVIEDFNSRVAAGLPEHVAFERAMAQHEHNLTLAEQKKNKKSPASTK